MIKAVFFDFDGVILESVNVKTEAFVELFSDHPQHVDEIVRYHLDHTGVSRFDKFRHIYGHILKAPLREQTFKNLCERFSGLVFEKVIASPYVAGIDRFIKDFCDTYDFFVVSATPHEEIRRICDVLMLTKYFKEVMGAPKPKGAWVKEMIGRFGYGKDEAFFVGDSLSDYQAASENGIPFVARVADANHDCFDGLRVHLKTRDFVGFDSLIRSIDY